MAPGQINNPFETHTHTYRSGLKRLSHYWYQSIKVIDYQSRVCFSTSVLPISTPPVQTPMLYCVFVAHKAAYQSNYPFYLINTRVCIPAFVSCEVTAMITTLEFKVWVEAPFKIYPFVVTGSDKAWWMTRPSGSWPGWDRLLLNSDLSALLVSRFRKWILQCRVFSLS